MALRPPPRRFTVEGPLARPGSANSKMQRLYNFINYDYDKEPAVHTPPAAAANSMKYNIICVLPPPPQPLLNSASLSAVRIAGLSLDVWRSINSFSIYIMRSVLSCVGSAIQGAIEVAFLFCFRELVVHREEFSFRGSPPEGGDSSPGY